jgi:DNA-binding transcriptional MerR regulator
MEKSLSQITFDFTEAAEDAESAAANKLTQRKAADIENNDAAALQEETYTIQKPAAETGIDTVKKKSTRGRTSLKDMALSADLVQVPPDEILFQKQYYSIGEVAGWFRLNQSLLRFWENEFDVLQPRKNRKGDRFFRPVDVKNLVLIHDLLRRRKFTIEGAKDYLKNSKKADEQFEVIQSLEKLKGFLLELKASL